MVDEVRAVAHLDEEVAVVVVEEVPRDAGALRLPVQPGAERAVVDAVVADDDVDGRVQLDAADLVAVELALEGDVVDVVVLDRGEHAAEVADDAVLAAVVDRVAADDVRADVLAVPADLAGGEHRLELVLVAGLVAAQRSRSCGPVEASLPRETAEHFASWMTLSSMIQPFAQFGPMRPGWSAVGGVHGQAACASSKPRTVM